MSEAFARLRPLAAGAILALFEIAMSDAIERESERTLKLAAAGASGGRSVEPE
jgi:hypothetical protein